MAIAENVGRTLVCSVRFLDIVGYSKQSVADQHRLKQAFNNTLSKALETLRSATASFSTPATAPR